ncbi:PilN domain-containing protein [Planococcus sp. YIM B11945]|uniref:PilN domain-containing protein n=1 Tax=Planococcus sp. YIM B11945 TaxID=3435410 RepID=UPI003D7DF8DB
MLVDINLLPQKERDRPVMLFAALGILVVAILIWAIFFFMSQSQTNEQTKINAEASQVAVEQAAIREQLEASVGMNEEQQLKATVDWAEGYQFDTIPLLKDLVSRLPERGFFDSFSFTKPNEGVLTIQFDTAREAAYYLTQLKASELLASVKLDSVTNEELTLAEDETDEDLDTDEEKIIENPRYLATYSLVYVDNRIPAEGTAEGEVVETPTTEVPAADAPTEAPATETPAEEPPAVDAAAPTETEGAAQ